MCIYIYIFILISMAAWPGFHSQWLRSLTADFVNCTVPRTERLVCCTGSCAAPGVCVCVWIFSSNLRVCYMENEWTWPVYRWFTTKNGDFPWRTLIAITKRWGNEKQGRVHPQNRHGLKFPWERTPKWRDQIPNQCFVCVLFDIGRDFIEHL